MSKLRQINIRSIIIVYMIIYFSLMGIYCGVNGTVINGEWDDYTLPAVSIIAEHNFSIVENDIVQYKIIFPEWAQYIDSYSLSNLYTKGGGEMAWYFPTYSAVCIPMILLLDFLDLPTTYAFVFTNFAMEMILLLIVFFFLKTDMAHKLVLIVLLSVNPIVFYFAWPSAETFIYAMIGIAMVFWYNKCYHRAALFVSIAGMLNPTIMSIGIIMIIEYLSKIWKSRDKEEKILYFCIKNLRKVVGYGFCYIIGLIPMAYNYYNTGYINLTTAHTNFVGGKESTISRFFAYLFDFNFGIFPYYPLVLIFGIILFILAFIKKHWRYITLFLAFIVNVILYSIMVHINSGMSGIARYNAWGVVILIFAVCLYFDELVSKKILCMFIYTGYIVNAILLAIIIYEYGPTNASKVSYIEWTPIAKFAFRNCPFIYSPLHSTFNSRTNNLDGGYEYETPIAYWAEDGYVRKILATSNDVAYLKENYISLIGDDKWFNQQIDRLTEEEKYISIPAKYKIARCKEYEFGQPICFYAKDFNASDYVSTGLGWQDEWGTIIKGNEMVIHFRSNSDADILCGEIVCSDFSEEQNITILVNDTLVFDRVVGDEDIKFDFKNPGDEKAVEIKIKIPNNILQIYTIIFYEKEILEKNKLI